jgi:EAL domain-containing protein (putative c-di-GMP-specific phosphodiesterase class I)/GGDEF domain-containing protein
MRRGIAVLCTALGASGLLLWTVVPPTGQRAAPAAVLVLALMYVAVEWGSLTLEHRGDTVHTTLSGLITALGVLFVGPLPTLAVRVIGGLLALQVRWRLPLEKQLFNSLSHVLEVWVVASVITAVAPALDGTAPRTGLAILLGLVAAELLSFAAVIAAVRISAGPLKPDVVLRMGVGTVYTAAISATFAVVAAPLIAVDPWAAVPLVAIFLLLVRTNRARHGLSERYRNLTSLYAFMDAVTSTDVDEIVPRLLAEAARATGAERVTLLLSTGRISAAFTDDGDAVASRPVEPAAVTTLAASVAGGRLLAVGEERPVPELTGPPADQALLVAFSHDTVQGAMLLEGRRGTLPDFDTTDLQLARGMARHAGTAVMTSRLVEQLQASTATMQRLALFDRDTGLPNRTGLLRMDLPVRDRTVALFEIRDLDTLEGTFGHRSARQIVQSLGNRLQQQRDLGVAVVARTAEDRFAVVVDDDGDAAVAHHRLKRLRAVLEEPIRDAGITVEVRVRVGAASEDGSGLTLEQLLRAASSALGDVRQAGGSGHETAWFDPSIDARASARMRLASDLREAIAAGDLSLAYQPKVELATGRVLGVEALCRWQRPDGSAVDPGEFITIAEHTGLIRPLTRWVVGEAVAQAARWRGDGLPLTVAINMSPDVLRDPTVVAELRERCEALEVPPDSVTVEVTESLMMTDDAGRSAVLRALDEAGVRISVDDFGTGYSSLAQLKDLPVDEVKIDRSFVIGIESSPADQAITAAIVAMAGQLGLDVVAEGVETPAAAVLLRDAGCRIAQGHLLGRPMSARDIAVAARRGADLPAHGVRSLRREA